MFISLEEQGNISVLTFIKKHNGICRARKLDKDHYVNIGTGEVCEYNHQNNRSGNMKSLMRTFVKLRGLINANASNPERLLWITLTYAENMTDTHRLYSDFKSFWKRFLTYIKRKGLQKPEYISVAEPQRRGAWHLHLLLIFPSRRPFIPNADIAETWRNGFTKTQGVDHGITNIGAYLCAYLTDIDVPVDDSLPTIEEEDGVKKSILKGGRLPLYPSGCNIYRTSRGIKRPTKKKISYNDAMNYMQCRTETYRKEQTIRDPNTGFTTDLVKIYFNERIPHACDDGRAEETTTLSLSSSRIFCEPFSSAFVQDRPSLEATLPERLSADFVLP